MKKYFTGLVLMGLTLLWACNDFLDIKPKGSLSESSLYTKEGIESLLIGAYGILDGTSNGYGNFQATSDWPAASSNWIYGSITGGDAHKGSDPFDVVEINPIEIYEALPTSDFLNQKWRAVYEGVSRANEVLKILPNVPELKAKDITRIQAEARVLRGIFHFEARKMWEMVPYVDELADPNVVKNDQDIWSLIQADLKFGYDSLPEAMDEKGRINKWVAGAFYAKALMFDGKYSEAKVVLENVYTSGTNPKGLKFQLAPAFHDNFNDVEKENREESVFAFQYSVKDKSDGFNGSWGELMNFSNYGPGGCCGFFQPSSELVNSFRTDANGLPLLDGSYNDLQNAVKDDEGIESDDESFVPDTGNLDPRVDVTVGRRGIPYLDWGAHLGKDWIRNQAYAGPYSPKKNVYMKSQQAAVTDEASWAPGVNSINFQVIRFADIILWLAECEVEVGSLSKAREYVNMIRTRAANPAGFVKAEDGVTDAAKYVVNAYPDSGYPFDTKVNARKAVHFERKLEFAMEGHRFFDLVRWNEAASTLNNYLSYEKKNREYLKDAVFQSEKDEYYPIPQHQIDLMGADILFPNRNQ